MERNAELVFIPTPGMGHLIPAVETAKKLVHRNHQISISILIMKSPSDKIINSYVRSLESDPSIKTMSRLKFIDLPQPDDLLVSNTTHLVESYKPIIRDATKDRVDTELNQPDSPRLAGFIIDMFCTTMIDVANELGVPTYTFLTSNVSFLSLVFHLQSLSDDHGVDVVNELNKPDIELDVPGYKNLVPGKVLPSILFDREMSPMLLHHATRFRETKGILINSFMELESHVFRSLYEDDKIPRVYPVGPIVNLGQSQGLPSQPDEKDSIMNWLDRQPPSSVVFLCFGSYGSFNEDQVKETAIGLWRSCHRFLWSLRRPAGELGEMSPPVDYDLKELRDTIMPAGFLDDTAEIGKVIGWAPQVEILAHPSVGAFVSHCGWNSTLESLWFGVPIVTWPLYAEQQLNAFELVKEFGLAVEIKIDYHWYLKEQRSNMKVTAEEVEEGVKKVMEEGEEVRKKVKEIKEKSRATVTEGGSSYHWIGKFIEDVFNIMPCRG